MNKGNLNEGFFSAFFRQFLRGLANALGWVLGAGVVCVAGAGVAAVFLDITFKAALAFGLLVFFAMVILLLFIASGGS